MALTQTSFSFIWRGAPIQFATLKIGKKIPCTASDLDNSCRPWCAVHEGAAGTACWDKRKLGNGVRDLEPRTDNSFFAKTLPLSPLLARSTPSTPDASDLFSGSSHSSFLTTQVISGDHFSSLSVTPFLATPATLVTPLFAMTTCNS